MDPVFTVGGLTVAGWAAVAGKLPLHKLPELIKAAIESWPGVAVGLVFAALASWIGFGGYVYVPVGIAGFAIGMTLKEHSRSG